MASVVRSSWAWGSRRLGLLAVGVALSGVSPGVAWGQACDTGLDADCDADGWSLAEGDCDDGDAAVNPGAPEDCTDERDNDCNGLFNDGCDRDVYNGSIGGGGGCTSESAIGNGGSSGGATAAWMVPLVGLGWVSRRCGARR